MTQFFSTHVVLGLLLIVFTFGLSLYFFLKKNYLALLSFFWFAICLIPYSGMLPLNSIYLEHWLYAPIVGLALGLALILDQLKKNQLIVLVVLLLGLLGFYALRTYARALEWSKPELFYQNEIAVGAPSQRMYYNLGLAYLNQKRWSEARTYLTLARDRISEEGYVNPKLFWHLAYSEMETGHYDLAFNSLQASLLRNREDQPSLTVLIHLLLLVQETNLAYDGFKVLEKLKKHQSVDALNYETNLFQTLKFRTNLQNKVRP